MTFLGILCFLCFEMGFSLPSLWSGKWVAQIGAFYCNGWILRATESEGTGLFFFSPLPSTPSQTLRKMANPTSTEEVTDSFRHDKPLWKSLADVDRVCVMFGEELFMQSDQTSFLISRVQLISLLHPCASLLIPAPPSIFTWHGYWKCS